MDTFIHVDTVQLSTRNVIIVATPVISLLYAGSPVVPEAQLHIAIQMQRSERKISKVNLKVKEKVNQQIIKQVTRAGHQTEADKHTEAHQDTPATVLHKTIKGEDHHVEEGAVQLLIGIRSATLCHFTLLPLTMKVNCIQTGHLMARRHFTQPSKWSQNKAVNLYPLKVDPGADINTIPLTCYKTIFPQHFTRRWSLKKEYITKHSQHLVTTRWDKENTS